jgi:hypothetical protein
MRNIRPSLYIEGSSLTVALDPLVITWDHISAILQFAYRHYTFTWSESLILVWIIYKAID